MEVESFDKKGVFKAMFIALFATILGIVVLGWQYDRLEKKQLPALEQKIEQQSAQNVLERFLETGADILLTEKAIEQKAQNAFYLDEKAKNYEIIRIDQLSMGEYRFLVKVGDFIEVFTLVQISGKYYIDSIETAG